MLPIFTFQAALCALVVLEAHSDVMTIDRRVCDYVIFDLDYPRLEQPFQISWHKISTPLLFWTHNNTRHGQHIRVFPNGTLRLHVVGKEDAGWYVARVCKSPQPCSSEKKFQLRVHGHLVRGHVGDCVTFDLNCLQSDRYIHVSWKKDNQQVAKIKQVENVLVCYQKRARVFLNGSLSHCPTQWGDEGEYVADLFAQDGKYLHQETFNLELNRVETLKEIREFIGGSMFLNLTETKLKHFFQVVWKKENTKIAWTNGSWLWYHEEYINRSEIVSNYSLRIDRIQKCDCGRYSIEANDRDERTVYKTIVNVEVDQNEMFRRTTVCVLLYIPLVLVGVLIMTTLVVLICCFQKCKNRSVPNIRPVSLVLTDEGDNPEEYEEMDENSPCSQNSETPSVQELDCSVEFVLRNKGSQRINQESDPATADKVMYFFASKFEDGERPKVPGLKGVKAVKPPASVNELCVAPNVKNTTHPEFERCSPLEFEDCLPPDFDQSIPLVSACALAELNYCSLSSRI